MEQLLEYKEYSSSDDFIKEDYTTQKSYYFQQLKQLRK